MQNTNPLWYKDAIIYQLHIRAFCDANEDGIGDFRGLTEQARLPARPGRQRHLAPALLPVAVEGRRLRHRRLPGRPPHRTARCTISAFSSARRTSAGCA